MSSIHSALASLLSPQGSASPRSEGESHRRRAARPTFSASLTGLTTTVCDEHRSVRHHAPSRLGAALLVITGLCLLPPSAQAQINCGDGILDIIDREECDEGVLVNGTLGSCCTAGCLFKLGGTVCRPSAGLCDQFEACTGLSALCPPDSFVPTGIQCRSATPGAACDVPESCPGTGPFCPPDAFASAGTVCRPSAGLCDAVETCSGVGPSCPGNSFVSAGTVCRASAGPCDPGETCSGTGPSCPGDSLAPPGSVCRPSAGPCDPSETCSGIAPSCPADAFNTGMVCRQGRPRFA